MLEETLRTGPRLIEVSHLAHRWSVSQEFVRRLIRHGKLPAILIGNRWRLAEPDIQAYLDRQRQAGLGDDDADACPPLHAVPQPKGA